MTKNECLSLFQKKFEVWNGLDSISCPAIAQPMSLPRVSWCSWLQLSEKVGNESDSLKGGHRSISKISKY
jgi:hypothetical protein